MVVSKAQIKAVEKYNKNNYEEIKIRVPKGKKEIIKDASLKRNETMNEFINKAIDVRLQE